MILVNIAEWGSFLTYDYYMIPALHINYTSGLAVYSYLNSTRYAFPSIPRRWTFAPLSRGDERFQNFQPRIYLGRNFRLYHLLHIHPLASAVENASSIVADHGARSFFFILG